MLLSDGEGNEYVSATLPISVGLMSLTGIKAPIGRAVMPLIRAFEFELNTKLMDGALYRVKCKLKV